MNSSKDSDGNSTKRPRKAPQPQEENPHIPDVGPRWPTVDETRMIAVARLFQDFLHRDDGYLKVKRDVDGPAVHLTWIWTYGKWTKYYVYVRIEYYDVGYGLELLYGKINSVEMGLTHPTPDRYGR